MTREPFRLRSEIDTTGFGDIGMGLGDLDNDGKQEIVFFQGQDRGIPSISAGGYAAEVHVYCITAMKMNGDVMWQQGTPLGTGYWQFHQFTPVISDINEDGRAEVLYLTERGGRSYLRMLDGYTGRLRKEVETGANKRLQVVDARGLGKRRDLIATTAVNPVYLYDDDLNCLWNCHVYGGAGHHHDFADVNGDGKEELFIGYCCVLSSGRKLWWRPDLEPHLEDMMRAPHADYIFVQDIDGDGRPEEIMVCGKDLVVLDATTGEDRWIYSGNHIQRVAFGKFYRDMDGFQLYAAERGQWRGGRPKDIVHRGYMLDSRGKELWRKDHCGYGHTVRITGSEVDYLFTTPPGRPPAIIDGQGNLIQVLDLPPATYRENPYSDTDGGVVARYAIADTDCDGRDEILVYNRTRLWHFVQD
jgi:hypothetical protein